MRSTTSRTDATRSVIEAVRPRNTLVVNAPGTIAEVRQRGALVSGGDIFVFTDADVEFDPTYFQRLLAMTRSAFFAVGGFRPGLRCNEDTELFLRAGRRGLRMCFDEQLIVWARDHRRLRRGRVRKAAHSVIRNCLLYLTCRQPRLPSVLEHDWGYWRTS